MEHESNVIISIGFVSVFLGIMILVLVIIIGALNSGNSTTGYITSSANESIIAVTNSPYILSQSYGTCTINSVKDSNGNTIPSSNYTINNCKITYSP